MLEFDQGGFDTLMAQRPEIGFKAYKGLARETAMRLAKSDKEFKSALTWAMAELEKAKGGGKKDSVVEVPHEFKPTVSKLKLAKKKTVQPRPSPPPRQD